MPIAIRVLDRAFTVWSLLFAALMTYWQAWENAAPGQQYADPLLPCAALAAMFAGPVFAVTMAVRPITDRPHRR